MFGFGLGELFFFLASLVLVVWPVCRIVGRTGYSPFLGLLVLVPLANIGLLFFLAFAEWPANDEWISRHESK